MPELPEVERWRKLAERVAVGRTIRAAHCAEDEIVFAGVPAPTVERSLADRRIEAARRRGKYLWLSLDRPPHPVFHFGMTGAFRVPVEPDLHLESTPKGGEGTAWPPRFTKLRLELDDGQELAYVNKRRLGRVRFRERPETEPPISRLGFDPLLDLPPPGRFAELVTKRTVTLKGLLLDQGFAAGVGNWMADEVLYQARLDPRRRASELSEAEVRRLRSALRRVVETSVGVDAEKDRLPRSWLFHHRWGRRDGVTTARGEPIEHLEVAGRTTAWVPSRQK